MKVAVAIFRGRPIEIHCKDKVFELDKACHKTTASFRLLRQIDRDMAYPKLHFAYSRKIHLMDTRNMWSHLMKFTQHFNC